MRVSTTIVNSNWIILLVAGIIWVVSNHLFHFDGLYGQDSYEYLRYSEALYQFFAHGIDPGDYFWPLYYPIVGGLLSFLLKPEVALQLISIFSFLITAKYLVKTIDLLYANPKVASLFIVLFFILSPTVFRLSLLVMSDMLTMLFIVLCYYNALVYFKKEAVSNIVCCVLFGVSALMTRYAAFVVLLPLGTYLLYFILITKERRKHLPLLVLIALLLFVPHIVIRSQNAIAFLGHDWLKEWSVKHFFKNEFHSGDGFSHYFLPNILYAFSAVFDPRYFFIGIFLIIPFFKTNNRVKFSGLIVTAFVLYGVFLAGIPYQNNRYLFLSFPIVLVVLFPYFNWIMERLQTKTLKRILIFTVVLIQMVLCVLSVKPILERNRFEREIALQMIPHQNNTLYSFDVDVALQGRKLQFNYQNLWVKKHTSFEENGLVLFHPTQFENKWKGHQLMQNWRFLQQHYSLKTINSFADGWILYKISKR